ncbi:MAG: DNA-processing protein DprA [Candidatus Binatia bacterium]
MKNLVGGMRVPSVSTLTRSENSWPRQLDGRLGRDAPAKLWAIGNLEILAERKVGLFCSVRCPGNAIIAAHDAARKLREDGTTVISGFQSPVEKECLRILLGGKQPVIICLARALGRIRLPAEWQKGLDADRVLILSPFEKRPPRPTVDSSRQRNELVAALADEVLIIYAQPGGATEQISDLIDRWHVPRRKLDSGDKRR